jgi:hypothetical protein
MYTKFPTNMPHHNANINKRHDIELATKNIYVCMYVFFQPDTSN